MPDTPMTDARLDEISALHARYVALYAEFVDAIHAGTDISDLQSQIHMQSAALANYPMEDLLAEVRRARAAEAEARAQAFKDVAEMLAQEGLPMSVCLVEAQAELDAEDRAQLAAKEA